MQDTVKQKEREIRKITLDSRDIDEELTDTKNRIMELKKSKQAILIQLDERTAELNGVTDKYESAREDMRKEERKTHELTSELDGLKLKVKNIDLNQDQKLETKALQSKLQNLQSDHQNYVLGLKDQIRDLEMKESSHEREIMMLRDRVQNAKTAAEREANEQIREVKGKFEREKTSLNSELKQLKTDFSQVQEQKQELESGNRELKALNTRQDEELKGKISSYREVRINWVFFIGYPTVF